MAAWSLSGTTRLRCPDAGCSGSVETCHPIGTAPVFGVCCTCGLEVVASVLIVRYEKDERGELKEEGAVTRRG